MNNAPELKVRKQRYGQNFKRSAVEHWLGGGKSANQVAAELGINAPTLKIWKQQLAGITISKTDEGFLYLAGVLDRCTRRCIGWAMDDTLATTLPLAALAMALIQRQPPSGLLHHSGRGVPYASESYRRRLALAGVVPSLSRRGNGYDNALMESFWSTLQRELVHRCQFATRASARTAIFEWIKVFYNRARLHSAPRLSIPGGL